MKLHICLDFDLTLVKIHTGGIYQKISLDQFVDTDKTREIIRKCIDKGHYFSIVSHGESREMILEAVEALGFSDDEIIKIAVIARPASDKILHIKEAKEFHSCNGNSRTILCDDDFTNISTAKKIGLAVIWAEKVTEGRISHLDTVLEILRKPCDACKICDKHAYDNNYDYLLPGYQIDIRPR